MEQELIARATRIYARTCEQEGSVYQQPGNVESSFDAKTQTVYGQPRDAYQGTRPPAEAQPREHARLLSCRPSGRLVLVLIEHDGETRLLRVEHCDAPELAVLSATDRASVAAAVAGLLREIPPDAA